RPGGRAMPDPTVVAQDAPAKLTLLPPLANRHGSITGATGTGKTGTVQVPAEARCPIGTPVVMADIRGDLIALSQAGASSPTPPALANRHGCITGATGTGKTVTLQVLAEAFSRIGTPVFMADIKGDLTGISQAGASSPKLQERLKTIGVPEPVWGASPAVLWDVFGEQGVPVRATVSDMGPLLLARMLELNDTQEGVLTLVFRVADDEGQLLLDLKDLRAMLQNVADRAAELKTQYGNVSSASVGAIQRSLLRLESQGADRFFGEPMLD